MKSILLTALLMLSIGCGYVDSCTLDWELYGVGNSIDGNRLCKPCQDDEEDPYEPTTMLVYCDNPESEFYGEEFFSYNECSCWYECGFFCKKIED